MCLVACGTTGYGTSKVLQCRNCVVQFRCSGQSARTSRAGTEEASSRLAVECGGAGLSLEFTSAMYASFFITCPTLLALGVA
ncbi:hypothetical protein L195_g018802 [Trifolium pratense]|uniref:Uncharacterized protein n=1 Tax=Trifolium pratense TaxID=57577 RepID=A0A2K3MXZ7_TRIPR|nr:hypothetical protein L195_g018802 [Trifolium pratense]